MEFTAAEKLNLKQEHEKMSIANIIKKYGYTEKEITNILGDGDNSWKVQ